MLAMLMILPNYCHRIKNSLRHRLTDTNWQCPWICLRNLQTFFIIAMYTLNSIQNWFLANSFSHLQPIISVDLPLPPRKKLLIFFCQNLYRKQKLPNTRDFPLCRLLPTGHFLYLRKMMDSQIFFLFAIRWRRKPFWDCPEIQDYCFDIQGWLQAHSCHCHKTPFSR